MAPVNFPPPATPRRDVRNSAGASPARTGPPSGSASPSPSTQSRPQLSLDVQLRSGDQKRLPSLPSPMTRGKEWALGAYDNKLVSSTLSQLPPLPPLSPSGMSSTGSNLSSFSHASTSPLVQAVTAPPPRPVLNHVPRPSPTPPTNSAGGVVVLPDGTKLPTGSEGGRPERESAPTVMAAMAHSSPSSPWSLLTVHVLPLFAGSPLKTPMEDLNQLCNSHIVATSQRTPASHLIHVLTTDLRDFIASGMLTLKAKFETIDESKVVSRAAEVWSFFWGQILPYVEGVFLPLAQVRDVPSSSTARTRATIASPPIPVRHILLSGFLVHILLPLLPRLLPLVTARQSHGSTSQDLPRLLQMSLVLSTQARYASFVPSTEERDEDVSESVEELGRAVRWSMFVVGTDDKENVSAPTSAPTSATVPNHTRMPSADKPVRPGLQRGPSVSQAGRLRRRGTLRGSISQLEPEFRREGEEPQEPKGNWGGMAIMEDDEGMGSMLSTVRGESIATVTDRTPTYAPAQRRPRRDSSGGESELTSVTASSVGRRQ